MANDHSWIKRFPNTGFGIPLGLLGNSILWNTMECAKFHRLNHSPADLGRGGNAIFWLLGVTALIIISCIYIAKLFISDGLVLCKLEWESASRMNFFMCPVVALLMASISAPNVLIDENKVGL